MIQMICYCYNFKLIHHSLLIDIIIRIKHFQHTDFMLTILYNSGVIIRQSNPLTIKKILQICLKNYAKKSRNIKFYLII